MRVAKKARHEPKAALDDLAFLGDEPSLAEVLLHGFARPQKE
jgi:hypothetical protein